LRLATSVYDIRYTNLQSAFNTSIGLAAFANLGDAKTQGIDLDVTWFTPIDGLNVSLIGNVNKGEFTDVVPAFAQANPRNGNGTRLFNTPPHNWRMDVGYDRDIGAAGWQLFGNASASMVGSARVQDATVNSVKSYSLYRASIGVRNGTYEATLYGDNLTDERGPTAANGPTLLAGPYPRTVGVTLRYRLD
jgi:hypothetical protein